MEDGRRTSGLPRGERTQVSTQGRVPRRDLKAKRLA